MKISEIRLGVPFEADSNGRTIDKKGNWLSADRVYGKQWIVVEAEIKETLQPVAVNVGYMDLYHMSVQDVIDEGMAWAHIEFCNVRYL